jgi:hypothetical protein
VAAVGIGEVGSVPTPVSDVIGGMIEQCTKRAAKGQFPHAGDDPTDKAHEPQMLFGRAESDPGFSFPGSPSLSADAC